MPDYDHLRTTTEDGELRHPVQKDPRLGSPDVDDLRTRSIGVSANQSQDLLVGTGSEERLALDDTTDPWFDDFDELDADQNEIVLSHASHHEIVAHAHMAPSGGAGEMWLRVYVNGVERALDHMDIKNNGEATAVASVYLKLEVGDVVHATVEHNTGSTETFPGGSGGNFVSVIRQ